MITQTRQNNVIQAKTKFELQQESDEKARKLLIRMRDILAKSTPILYDPEIDTKYDTKAG